MDKDTTRTLLLELEKQVKKAVEEITNFKKKEKEWNGKKREIKKGLEIIRKKIEEFADGG